MTHEELKEQMAKEWRRLGDAERARNEAEAERVDAWLRDQRARPVRIDFGDLLDCSRTRR